MIGIYDSDMGHFDGLTRGREYWLEEESEEQYLVPKNDAGATSRIMKWKFKLIEPLVAAAEKAAKGE